MPPTDTSTNGISVQFASIRIIADDLKPLVRFYEILAGTTAQWLTDDFVEVVTPSATVAISHYSRVSFLGDDAPRPAASQSVVYEFLVEDVEALFAKLQAELGDDLVVAQGLTMMPWGNISLLIRDPAWNPHQPVHAKDSRCGQAPRGTPAADPHHTRPALRQACDRFGDNGAVTALRVPKDRGTPVVQRHHPPGHSTGPAEFVRQPAVTSAPGPGDFGPRSLLPPGALQRGVAGHGWRHGDRSVSGGTSPPEPIGPPLCDSGI
jgi:hypothetical protein